MNSGSKSYILVFYILLLSNLQCVYNVSAREINRKGWNRIKNNAYDLQETHKDHHHSSSTDDLMDPALQVFFTVEDLRIGKKMPVYFSIQDLSTSPRFLSRKEANDIPFSSSSLQYLLKFFNFSSSSPQAEAMEQTLHHCKFEPMKGETKFCATSLESLLDSARAFFCSNTNFKAMTTNRLYENTSVALQEYTFAKAPREIVTSKILGCHPLPYPYVVFYCHSQGGGDKLFEISLSGENGEGVDAVAVCHMDTSQWDEDHVAFRVLKMTPGSAPVCHFVPTDNFVWVASASMAY